MAFTVVDIFKVIQIKVKQRTLLAASLLITDAFLDFLCKGSAV